MRKPSIFRRIILFIVDTWRVVMDVKYNPLKHIPDPSLQTYFMLVLFTIWSVAFGLIAIFWLGFIGYNICLLYTSPSPRDTAISRMPSSA